MSKSQKKTNNIKQTSKVILVFEKICHISTGSTKDTNREIRYTTVVPKMAPAVAL